MYSPTVPTDPLAEAAFLVCEALHLPPDRFEVFAAARVARHEQKKIFDLIETRIRTRKPAAYLMQKAYLRGVPFFVDERAIVPRSYLGEILDGELFGGDDGSLIDDPHAVERVLDLCTGFGLPCGARRHAVSRTPSSMPSIFQPTRLRSRRAMSPDTASTSASRSTAATCSRPVRGERYDLIISNPPYVDADGMAALPPECRHEPALALDGGPDGIAIVRRIIDNAGRHLTAQCGSALRGRARPPDPGDDLSGHELSCGSIPRKAPAKCSGSMLPNSPERSRPAGGDMTI